MLRLSPAGREARRRLLATRWERRKPVRYGREDRRPRASPAASRPNGQGIRQSRTELQDRRGRPRSLPWPRRTQSRRHRAPRQPAHWRRSRPTSTHANARFAWRRVDRTHQSPCRCISPLRGATCPDRTVFAPRVERWEQPRRDEERSTATTCAFSRGARASAGSGAVRRPKRRRVVRIRFDRGEASSYAANTSPRDEAARARTTGLSDTTAPRPERWVGRRPGFTRCGFDSRGRPAAGMKSLDSGLSRRGESVHWRDSSFDDGLAAISLCAAIARFSCEH